MKENEKESASDKIEEKEEKSADEHVQEPSNAEDAKENQSEEQLS